MQGSGRRRAYGAGSAGGVADLADELLQHVLERDQPGAGGGLSGRVRLSGGFGWRDLGQVGAGALQNAQDLTQRVVGGDGGQRPDPAWVKRPVAHVRGGVEQVLDVDVAPPGAVRFSDREAGEPGRDAQLLEFGDGRGRRDRHQLGGRDRQVRGGLVVELQRSGEQVVLAVIQQSLAAGLAHQTGDLVAGERAGDLILGLHLDQPQDQVRALVEQPDQRSEHGHDHREHRAERER